MTLVIAVFSALLGFYLPDIWLRQKTDKRKEKILHALPDALDLLVISVEAGMGLDSAFYRVAHAISDTLPNKKKKLLDGFLSGRERLKEQIKSIS